MKEPRRLVDEKHELKRAGLRSAALDEPSARSLRKARSLALGLAASSTMSGAGSAATGLLGSSLTAKGIAGWVGVGVLSGLLVVATGALLGKLDSGSAPVEGSDAGTMQGLGTRPTHATPSASEPNTASPARGPGEQASNGTKRTASRRQPSARQPVMTPVPLLPDASATERLSSAGSLNTLETQVDAGMQSDQLAKELAEIDRARSSLRGGKPAAALALLSRYEQTYRPPHFAPEAGALRIDALIAEGRRSEALDQARRFITSYPAHPLTPRFRVLVGSP